jgi:hypothetical protein
MNHPTHTFGPGNPLPAGAASPAARRATRWSLQPLAVARRACDYIEAAVCGLAEALFGLWGLDAEEDDGVDWNR